jgi:hypothetical protein
MTSPGSVACSPRCPARTAWECGRRLWRPVAAHASPLVRCCFLIRRTRVTRDLGARSDQMKLVRVGCLTCPPDLVNGNRELTLYRPGTRPATRGQFSRNRGQTCPRFPGHLDLPPYLRTQPLRDSVLLGHPKGALLCRSLIRRSSVVELSSSSSRVGRSATLRPRSGSPSRVCTVAVA